jgi:5-methylthioadenosine/S-adenosylhomocysteine deaminase
MTNPDSLQAQDMLLASEWALLDDGPAQGVGVVVSNGRFIDVGPLDAVAKRHPQLAALSLPQRLLMPGFIDAHHHLTQSFGKALAFGEPSEIYRRIWVPLESELDEQALYLSSKLAALEALRGGFTTVCDAGTRAKAGLDAIAAAAHDVGVRCVLARVCNDAGASSSDAKAMRIAAERHLAQGTADALVHPSLAVSVPEAASDEMMGHVAALCREAGALFQVHANEHLASVERSLVERGLRPLEHLERAGALGPQTLVAHATLVTARELALLRDTDTAVSYNPVASAWKGNAVAPMLTMAALGIRFGLGTDGTRSDGFRLMDAAETAQRLAFGLQSGDSSCGAGWTWLDHATADGAQAVGLAQRTGRIAAGLAADFLLIDLDVPEMTPSWDLSWELVRLANRDQIEAVFVDGKLRLWKGWPLEWDAKALMREAQGVARRAVGNAPIQRIHPTAIEHRRQAREPAQPGRRRLNRSSSR